MKQQEDRIQVKLDPKEIAKDMSIFMPRIARRMFTEFYRSFSEISQAQLFAIIVVSENDPCRLSTLSDELSVSGPTITGIVDRLESSGYVQRTPDPDDRRAMNVVMTSKGREVVRKFRSVVRKKWQTVIESLDRNDLPKFIQVINIMLEVVK
jgi:DNA-binding MarR family transcriptional regulator